MKKGRNRYSTDWREPKLLIGRLRGSSEAGMELVDFYHAVEHLGKVAACRKSWSSGERAKWVKKHKKLLKAGKIQQVLDALKALCKGRSSKEFRRERDYFLKNQDRMNYHEIEGMELPIGSGAMESAIQKGRQFEAQGSCNLLGCRNRRGHVNSTIILQCRSLEHVGKSSSYSNT